MMQEISEIEFIEIKKRKNLKLPIILKNQNGICCQKLDLILH